MQSESIAAIAGALSIFQGACEPAHKNAANPHLKNRYADLASIWDAIREPLAASGLAVVQIPLPSDGWNLRLRTQVIHTSGEWLASEITMPIGDKKQDPQGYGSALTYARRYALAAMLGVTQDDDDADNATRRPPAAQAPAGITEQQMKMIGAAITRVGMDKDGFIDWMNANARGKQSRKDLTKDEASRLIDHLGEMPSANKEQTA